ncbi:hypothetical protein PanWU01x14_207050, partial [Parasponia andersonii]
EVAVFWHAIEQGSEYEIKDDTFGFGTLYCTRLMHRVTGESRLTTYRFCLPQETKMAVEASSLYIFREYKRMIS